jgi:hypothetical protein
MKKYIILASILLSGTIMSQSKFDTLKSSFSSLPSLKEILVKIKVLLTSIVEFCPIMEELADIAGSDSDKAKQIKQTCLAAKRLNDLSNKSRNTEIKE